MQGLTAPQPTSRNHLHLAVLHAYTMDHALQTAKETTSAEWQQPVPAAGTAHTSAPCSHRGAHARRPGGTRPPCRPPRALLAPYAGLRMLRPPRPPQAALQREAAGQRRGQCSIVSCSYTWPSCAVAQRLYLLASPWAPAWSPQRPALAGESRPWEARSAIQDPHAHIRGKAMYTPAGKMHLPLAVHHICQQFHLLVQRVTVQFSEHWTRGSCEQQGHAQRRASRPCGQRPTT